MVSRVFPRMQEEKVDCVLVFPEDLDGHQIRGPASIWQLREFQVLESVHDVRRGAGFLCQLANAEAKRPLGILTTLAKLQTELCVGWPRFEIHAEILHYVGPLPRDCGCPNQHSPMIGQSTDHHFHSSLFPTLGTLFWKRFWDSMAEEKVPLGAGKFSEPFSSSLQSPSLADGVDSSQHMFNLWKARSLNRVRLRGWAADKEVNGYLDSMFTVTSSSSLPVSAVMTRRSWSLDALGLLVESMVHEPPVLPTSSSSTTGIRQVVPSSGISSRTSTRYSASCSWQWYILSYTFKVHQNFKMAPGFGEAEGRWPCHSAPVAFFFWSGVRAAFCSFSARVDMAREDKVRSVASTCVNNVFIPLVWVFLSVI